MMSSDQPPQDTSKMEENASLPSLSNEQPFPIQLLEIFPIEIVARRFPRPVSTPPASINVQFNLTELSISPESLQAQVALEVRVEPDEEKHSFEIFFKLLALFSYGAEHTPEMVRQLIQPGVFNLMIPFVRELILSLSTRLHLPPIVLSLVPLTSPPTTEN